MKVKQLDENKINRLISKIDSGQDELYGYDEEKKILENVLNKTFKNGESSSVIIYGCRGSGKTCLLDHCLKKKVTSSSRRRTIIKLDGAIHNTDALALSVIAQCVDIPVTNASQIGTALQEKISSSKTIKTFCFILNEIDIFCRRQQTLLYTLFDAVHYVPGICLIGLTAKADCTDYVEKRVRSRMSYQTIVLSSPFKNQKEYFDYVKNYLEGAFSDSILKPLVFRQYKKSRTPGDMKKFMLDLLLSCDSLTASKSLTNDRKVQLLESLSFLELAVVCLISKKLSDSGKTFFRPIEIAPLLRNIPAQISHSKELFLFVLHRLIDYGLLFINPGQRYNSYISDWTSLSLNADLELLKFVLNKNKKDLPTNFLHVLETTA
ncbi:origin recognition complex subunit 4-like [Tetranychus urticae]|uniref:origin recognition complex subunit 4-like n=1 Tax=Tetranychus urticae TaxID=32264 RepID=UPI00077BF47A|nr:origin recognition complex subunit 4-like [Tetranychus urticae]